MSAATFFATLFGMVVGVLIEHVRQSWDRLESRAKRGLRPIRDSADQLRVVTGAQFRPRKLLSRSEARVFYAVERAVQKFAPKCRVMAQVNLGEILSCPDRRAFSAVNSKRVDILVVSQFGDPVAAVEYQGDGHYQGDAPARDAVKREALRTAGISFIEVSAGDTETQLSQNLARLLAAQAARRAA